jgi:hypothetical protein
MYNRLLSQNPQLEELLRAILHEVEQAKRPAEEVILDDIDLQKMLKCSKRKTAQLREQRAITYSKPDGKVYYTLADVLEYVRRNEVPAIIATIKFKT